MQVTLSLELPRILADKASAVGQCPGGSAGQTGAVELAIGSRAEKMRADRN